jgi:hypothetical protein
MPHNQLKRPTPTLTPAKNHPNQTVPATWAGWYFQDGYLCTPENDRYTANCIRACFFLRQMREHAALLYSNTKARPEFFYQ